MSTHVFGFEPPAPKRCRRTLRRAMVGYVSKHQGKRTVNTKEKLLKQFLDTLVLNSRYTHHSEDLVMSTQGGLTKKYNCAVVKDYCLRLPSLNQFWPSAGTVYHAAWLGTVPGLTTMDLRYERAFSYRNTTNFNLYVNVCRCTAKADVPDDRQPSQCWQLDIDTIPAGDTTYALDLATENRSVYNLSTWRVGGRGTEFSKYWTASPWERYCVTPGKTLEWKAIEHVVMTKSEYDTYTADDLTVFAKGQKGIMVKVVAEKAMTNQQGLAEADLEVSAQGISFSPIVEYLEVCDTLISLRIFPGFAASVMAPVTNTLVTGGVGNFGGIQDAAPTTWANGKIYSEPAGAWTAPTVVEDMTALGVVESAAEQAQGVDEGLGSYRQAMETV